MVTKLCVYGPTPQDTLCLASGIHTSARGCTTSTLAKENTRACACPPAFAREAAAVLSNSGLHAEGRRSTRPNLQSSSSCRRLPRCIQRLALDVERLALQCPAVDGDEAVHVESFARLHHALNPRLDTLEVALAEGGLPLGDDLS